MNNGIRPAAIGCLALLFLSACRKTNTAAPEEGNLLGFLTERVIKINQEVRIYDSTAIKDSIDFITPPTSRTYRWKLIPDNHSTTFSGPYQHGLAHIIFKQAGDYKVTAGIYDSTGLHYLGNADTVTVHVAADTLYPTQPIQPDDELLITPTLVSGMTSSGQVNYFIQLIMGTMKFYSYYSPDSQFEYSLNGDNNTFTLIFSDSIRLATYPVAWGYGMSAPVVGITDIDLSPGDSMGIRITWLNKVYTGGIKLVGPNRFDLAWDNSGAVKMIQ